MRVELSLPDELYHRAQQLAQVSHRGITDVLVDTLSLSLPLIDSEVEDTPLSALSDVEIRSLTHLQLEPQADQRLSILLDAQQAGELIDPQRATLDPDATVANRAFAQSPSASGSSPARVTKAPIGVRSGYISEAVRARLRDQAEIPVGTVSVSSHACSAPWKSITLSRRHVAGRRRKRICGLRVGCATDSKEHKPTHETHSPNDGCSCSTRVVNDGHGTLSGAWRGPGLSGKPPVDGHPCLRCN